MGKVIYHIIVRAFNLLLLFYSCFNRKAKLLVAGRRNSFDIITKNLERDGKVLWFHCASLGEFEQGLPLMEAIKSYNAQYRLYVSFFSPSGYEVHRNNPIADYVFYLPAETRANAQKLIHLLNPVAAFFIKYEFWYHYLNACQQGGVPVFSVSTILRPDQVFFKFYGGFYRKMLFMFRHFFVQNEETMELLKQLGLKNITLSGDTRFDRVNAILKNNKEFTEIKRHKGSNKLIVLGSTWKPDIDIWSGYINRHPELKYIIAPHNIDEEDLLYIEKKLQVESKRYGDIRNKPDETSALIIDNIGMLSAIYLYADIVYVGGSFGEGLHNILEPAAFGKPIIIGKAKSNRKYQEATSLIKAGGAFEVSRLKDLEEQMDNLLCGREYYAHACEASRVFVQKNLGTTKIIMKALKDILS